ncbi:MAG: pyrroline-5-carboxylate reductase [Pseudomonadota bacterium]
MHLSNLGSVLLLGCGKMGGAMLSGWLDRGLPAEAVTVVDPGPPPEIVDLINRHGIKLASAPMHAEPAGTVIAAVKPQIMGEALTALSPTLLPDALVVSIAAGPTVVDLARPLPDTARIVRAMPNTPAAIGQGITAAFAGPGVDGAEITATDALLSAIGTVVWVADEALMDAVTAVSGSGPAYVFLLAECLAEAGVEAGLPADIAAQLARATVSGAGALLAASDLPAGQLRQNVTSPNGTTAAALSVLMAEDGLKPLLWKAVATAKRRSAELSG